MNCKEPYFLFPIKTFIGHQNKSSDSVQANKCQETRDKLINNKFSEILEFIMLYRAKFILIHRLNNGMSNPLMVADVGLLEPEFSRSWRNHIF